MAFPCPRCNTGLIYTEKLPAVVKCPVCGFPVNLNAKGDIIRGGTDALIAGIGALAIVAAIGFLINWLSKKK